MKFIKRIVNHSRWRYGMLMEALQNRAILFTAKAVGTLRSETRVIYFPCKKLGSSYFGKSIRSKGSTESRFFVGVFRSQLINAYQRSHMRTYDGLQIGAEILKATKRIGTFVQSIDKDCMLPVMTKLGEALIEVDGKQSTLIDVKSLDRFQWLKLPGGSTLTLKSDYDLTVGTPIALTKSYDCQRDLVLVLFVDGLADVERLGIGSFADLMPKTSRFFSSGSIFSQHFANAEWTLPSVASLFTGSYTNSHGLYHPDKRTALRHDVRVLSEVFQEHGYNTFHVGGNWRMSPPYGYMRGFDRTVYKNSMECEEVIDCFIENNLTFKSRSQFAWLTFMDLHHEVNLLGRLDSISGDDGYTQWPSRDGQKSVFKRHNSAMINNYISNIRSLDSRLSSLYSYIEDSYTGRNTTIILTSDHGQSYLSEDSFPLKDERVMVPLFYRSPISSGWERRISEFTECVDVPLMLLKDSGICTDEFLSRDGRIPKCMGGSGRSFAYSQSIFPGQTYKSRFTYSEGTYLCESTQLTKTLEFLPSQTLIEGQRSLSAKLPSEVRDHLESN